MSTGSNPKRSLLQQQQLQQQQQTSNITHTNKYSILNIIENTEEETSNTKTEPKTPPIFVQNVTNYTC